MGIQQHSPSVSIKKWSRRGVVVSAADFRSEGLWFEARSVSLLLCCFLAPHCLSSPRCTNGYRRHTAGGNPVMD